MESIPLRILYVEDSHELRDTIAMLMEGPGRRIVACASAEEALRHCADEGGFDLVVTDMSLPGMSGTQLCQALLERDPQQRIVLCSGYPIGAELRQAGPHIHVLPKPFDIDALEGLLDSIQAELQGAGVG